MRDEENCRDTCVSGERARSGATLRAAARSKLAEARRSRLIMAREMRKALQSSRVQIRGLAESICSAARQAMEDDVGAHKGEELEVPEWEDRKWDFGPEGDTALCVTKQDLMEAIDQHPEGVSLAEIGNELGTDWRGLVNWSRRLVIDGKIEQLDELFYPPRE